MLIHECCIKNFLTPQGRTNLESFQSRINLFSYGLISGRAFFCARELLQFCKLKHERKLGPFVLMERYFCF